MSPIAGESAGALSVVHLVGAPAARGLFDRAISQGAYMITQPEFPAAPYADWPTPRPLGV